MYNASGGYSDDKSTQGREIVLCCWDNVETDSIIFVPCFYTVMSQDPTFTVRNVATAIREVANTRLLGTELDLSSVCLDKIAKHDASEHNLRLVEAWLRLDPNPTWRKLVEALRSPLVEENTIAQEIEENYILRRGSITSDFSSPPASPMSLGSVPSPSSSLTSSMFRSGSSGDRNGKKGFGKKYYNH